MFETLLVVGYHLLYYVLLIGLVMMPLMVTLVVVYGVYWFMASKRTLVTDAVATLA